MLDDVHGIIIGGTQNFVGDECVHDYNGNIINLLQPSFSKKLIVLLNNVVCLIFKRGFGIFFVKFAIRLPKPAAKIISVKSRILD